MLFLSNRGGGGGGGGNSGGSSSGGGGGSSWFSSAEKKDPADLAKEWKRNLQKEMRHLDRDILNLKRQEDRAMKECKALAKKNQLSSAKVLAKEIARTRKTIERMHTSKAQMNSVCNNLQTSMCKCNPYDYNILSFPYNIFNCVSLAMLKMQGCIAKSADIMHAMNELVNIKDLKESMGSMAREMERAGLIEEMMSETMDMMDVSVLFSVVTL